jgi:magnesium-transporting ATPase (P-type)
MDTFAALALATEPPCATLLDRQPESREDKIVNAVMWRNIFGQSTYQMVVLMLLLFCGKGWFGFSYPNDVPLVYTTNYCDANLDNPALSGGCIVNDLSEKAELYTIVFQAFVFMTLFN